MGMQAAVAALQQLWQQQEQHLRRRMALQLQELKQQQQQVDRSWAPLALSTCQQQQRREALVLQPDVHSTQTVRLPTCSSSSLPSRRPRPVHKHHPCARRRCLCPSLGGPAAALMAGLGATSCLGLTAERAPSATAALLEATPLSRHQVVQQQQRAVLWEAQLLVEVQGRCCRRAMTV